MRPLLLGSIRLYQRWLSPLLGTRCRFHPSCSHYTAQSIQRFGVFGGSLLGAFRIIRCQPFNRGGFDTVPERFPGRFWRRNPDQSAPPGTDEAHPCAQASTPCSHQE